VKFLFSFAALIFFPPQGLSFGINRYRAGAKVWQRALEIKGRAFGFQKKSPHRWVVFFRKILL